MEEQKKLLSIRDLVVKFRVRGRILTAIRGISLDIYENESIAIVGESGSGKSVFTKTFAGMLDENGFIDQGSLQFMDESLSDTTVAFDSSIASRIAKIERKLNRICLDQLRKDAEEAAKAAAEEADGKDAEKNPETETADAETELELDEETLERNRNIAFEIAFFADEQPGRGAIIRTILDGLAGAIAEKHDISVPTVREQFYKITKDTEWKKIRKIAERLDKLSVYEAGADIYKEIAELDKAKQERGRLSDLEYLEYQKKIEEISFRKAESYNFRQTLDSRKQKAEIKQLKAEEKKLGEELKKIEEALQESKKVKKKALAEDRDYNDKWNESRQKLEDSYRTAVSTAVVSDETKTRNRMLAREIVLSTGRFPYFRRKSCQREIFKKLKQGMKEGQDLNNPDVREQLYHDVTFRVEYRSKDANGFHGFANIDLAMMKYSGDWMEVRGERIATVFQDPMTSLNPIITIGKQITSVIIKHQHCSESEARKRALILMKKVGIPNAEKRFDDYPFQYSGGMRQRIVIAIALSCQPKILICDEPTTALDVTIQAQILKLIKDLQKEFGYTIVFITHDLGVVANIADRVAVLYAGQIVELGKVEEVFYDPRHPYTWALLSSLPQLAQRNTKLFSIQGTPPSLYNKIIGDPFAPRNQYCMKIDTLKEPPYFPVSETHIAKTWLLDPRSPKVEKPEAIHDIHDKLKKAFNI